MKVLGREIGTVLGEDLTAAH
ncbi:unnamed protein product [Ectocarpus sp. CCAP 1310/34]|nr:unnamed protein product [Ectocarpus sp. CCAP 1310/34]